MIREERNALLLLLAFALGAFALYFFVLRPALENEATPAGAPGPVEVVDDSTPDPRDARSKSARRMFALRLHVFDAMHGGPIDDASLTILGAEDVAAEPAVTRSPAGGVAIDLLPPGITFGLKISAPGYRTTSLARLRGEARQIQDLGVIALEPLRRLDITVLDSADKPIADATLTLFALDAALDRKDGFERAARLHEALAATPAANNLSGKDGAAVFSSLVPRRYVLRVDVPGRASQLVPEIDLTRRSAFFHVPVPEGAPARGRVLRADGSPPNDEHARLLLLEFPSPGAELLSIADVAVAADGNFTVPRLSPLPHVAIARVAGAADMVSGPWPVTDDAACEIRVEPGCVARGAVIDADKKPIENASVEVWCKRRGAPIRRGVTAADGTFRIDRLPACAARLRVLARVEGADERTIELTVANEIDAAVRLLGSTALEGAVQNDRGEPLAGALVETVWPPRHALADLAGKFRLDGLAPGDLVLRATWPGFRAFESKVTVRLRETAFLDCPLQPEHVLRVTVLSPEKATEANVPVLAIPLNDDGTANDAQALASTSGDDGIARFPGLAPKGRYILLSSGGSGAPVKSQPFDLDANAASTAVALTQRAGGFIEGVARADDGSPLPFALVRAHGTRDEWFERLVEHTVRPVLTSKSGYFKIEGLPPGTYRVTASKPGRAPAALADLVLTERGALTNTDLVLAAANDLVGVVTDSEGRTIAGAEVTLAGDAGAQLTTTVLADGAGRFRFAPEPQPGVILRARGPAHGSGRAEPATTGATTIVLTEP